jgi:hypothetical protein
MGQTFTSIFIPLKIFLPQVLEKTRKTIYSTWKLHGRKKKSIKSDQPGLLTINDEIFSGGKLAWDTDV